MNEIDPAAKIKTAEGPLAEKLGDELAILDPNSGLYFGLNEVGARVWELLQEPTTINSIADQLSAEYEVERARCEVDVRNLVGKMLEAKLIQTLE